MSASFDGVDDQVHLTSITLPSTRVVLAVWLKPTNMGEANSGYLMNHGGNPDYLFNGSAGSNKLRWRWFWTGTDGVWDMATALTMGAWNHVVVQYNGPGGASTVPKFYLNGALVSTTTIAQSSGSIETNGSNIIFGGNGAGAFSYQGLMADEALYFPSALLSDEEVKALYVYGPAQGRARWGHWKMESSGGLGKDYSGNNRHLTVTGAVLGEDAPRPARNRRGV